MAVAVLLLLLLRRGSWLPLGFGFLGDGEGSWDARILLLVEGQPNSRSTIKVSRAGILSLALRICSLVSPTLSRGSDLGGRRGSDVRRQGIWVEGFIVRHLECALLLLSFSCSALLCGRKLERGEDVDVADSSSSSFIDKTQRLNARGKASRWVAAAKDPHPPEGLSRVGDVSWARIEDRRW